MRVGIVDADLIGRKRHRFPNLACMKISGYHKAKGDKVTLITEYFKSNEAVFQKYYNKYDKIYVSKVFVDTPVPYDILNLSITVYGGTGFFYGDAEPLYSVIEHSFPDYHLYDDWIAKKREEGKVTDREFIYYEQYSIGYTSRKCVRQCKFCVNQHSTKVEKGSPVKEFLDNDRKFICLLDDNILAYENWKEVFEELNATGKTFEYKQGFDIRALNDEKAEVLINSNFNKTFLYFAFDNIKDRDIIEEKLKLWKSHYKKHINMYILCGFDEENKYDDLFWARDVENTLERIKICIKYGVYPYIMKYRMCNTSPDLYRGMYINLGSWCNQRNLFAKWSLNEWADNIQKANEKQLGKKELFSSKRYLFKYAGQFPEIAYRYFDLKYHIDTDIEYRYQKNSSSKENKVLREKIDYIFNFDITENKEKINVVNGKAKNSNSKLNSIQKKNIVFAIKNKKGSIKITKKITKIDKTKSKQNKSLSERDIVIAKPINQTNALEWFKTKERDIENGIVVNYNPSTMQSIKNKSINLILVNIKEEVTEQELALLKHCNNYLNNLGYLYVFNSNLKTFNTTKDFIEKNTSLKYRNVINFKDGSNIKSCSIYSYDNNSVSWDNNTTYKDKNLLVNDIIDKNSHEKDIILSFFNRYDFIELFSKAYKNRTWICVKKTRGTKDKWKHNDIMTLDKNIDAQTSLLDSEDKNIG